MNVFTLLVVAETTWTDDLKRTLFAREGRRIVTAQTVAEAQQKARFAPPDLVVTKRRLPDGTGDDLCRWFRAQADMKSTRLVVMVAGDAGADTDAELRGAGVDQVLQQPSTPDLLTPLIAQIIDAPLRQEIRVPVEMRVEGESAQGILQGLTRNLSPSGALVEITSGSFNAGDVIYVRLHPAGATSPIVAKAEVKRVSPQPLVVQVGVRFLRFDRDGEKRLKQYLISVGA